ncbi:unnamed protein product [Caenorhabditis auriculariae]|uniref:Uncharacterized protein n=1 Tax=Caenorhabditis auriculariae TaxID=2777116 RepID=A0A8S1HKL8_9PELO|nr:unnamed protein product [Caenorhabditis auriculariae]
MIYPPYQTTTPTILQAIVKPSATPDTTTAMMMMMDRPRKHRGEEHRSEGRSAVAEDCSDVKPSDYDVLNHSPTFKPVGYLRTFSQAPPSKPDLELLRKKTHHQTTTFGERMPDFVLLACVEGERQEGFLLLHYFPSFPFKTGTAAADADDGATALVVHLHTYAALFFSP